MSVGSGLLRIQGSVSSKEEILAIVKAFEQTEKHLDVLVNCAGGKATLLLLDNLSSTESS